MAIPRDVDGGWIRRFHGSPTAGPRVVCFPHAGGSASFYLSFSARLCTDVEVLCVQYPGRQDRRAEKPIDDIGELADRIAAVPGLSDGRPTVFFGHSMGAIVAFEVARRVQDRGSATPAALVASARRAPSIGSGGAVRPRDDAALVAMVGELAGTHSALLGDAEMLGLILPALRSDHRAVETYRCAADARLTCPILALVGESDPVTTVEDARAWREHTTGGFELRVFPGGHFYLVDSPEPVIDVVSRYVRDRGAAT